MREIETLRQTILEEKYSAENRLLEVTYLYGASGAGKTWGIFERHDPKSICRITDYGGRNGVRFDAYRCQDVLVFEEFHSQIPIGAMLNYDNFYPKEQVQRMVMAEALMDGRSPEIKTGLINMAREMDIMDEIAPLIERLDTFERENGINTYSVYQLQRGDEMRNLRFEPLDRLHATGHSVDSGNYELIYCAALTPADTLETIYTDLNIDRPDSFHGHSLSVSDVVVFQERGRETAHYCDSFGFKEVPEFLTPTAAHEKDNPLRTAEMTVEDDYAMIDGTINNGRRDEVKEKPSIRERLAEAKRECAERTPPEKGREGRSTPEHGDL